MPPSGRAWQSCLCCLGLPYLNEATAVQSILLQARIVQDGGIVVLRFVQPLPAPGFCSCSMEFWSLVGCGRQASS